MAKRIKRVFNSEQVCHVWASQSQSDGRNSQRNIYFEGTDLYSYGSHYLLGRIYPNNVALINSTRYSVTTSKHQTYALRAVSHMKSFFVSNPDNPVESIKDMQAELIDDLMNILSQNRPYFYIKYNDKSWILNRIDDLNKLCNIFNQPNYKLELTDDFIELMLSHQKLRDDRNAILDAPKIAARKERERLNEIERKKKKVIEFYHLRAWHEGLNISSRDLPFLTFDELRVNKNIVETSGGAEVPLSQALLLLERVIKHKVKIGDQVGHFKVDEIHKKTIDIGCHSIKIKHALDVLKPYLNQVHYLTEENL